MTATIGLDDFVSRGWEEHAKDSAGVFARLPQGIPLIEKPAHLASLANLATHVAGEHLGRWDDGIAFVERLRAHALHDAATTEGKAIARSLAVLHHCAGRKDDARRLAGSDSDRARVLAVAASALAGQNRIDEARTAFEGALALAGGSKDDPATRAIAATANNLACALEEKPSRTDAERILMVVAATKAFELWYVAGGPLERERAQYRLCMSLVKAGRATEALGHAREALRIIDENGLDASERFFAHEAAARALLAPVDPLVDIATRSAAARAERDAMRALLAKIEDAGTREWCEGELKKLDADLGSP